MSLEWISNQHKWLWAEDFNEDGLRWLFDKSALTYKHLEPSCSISFLFFADWVNQLPLGVVGVAVGALVLGDDDGVALGLNDNLKKLIKSMS